MPTLPRFDPEARKLRLETVMQFLRMNVRPDGVVPLTSRDILRYLEADGEPVHSLQAVRGYLTELRRGGKVAIIPFSPELGLPTDNNRTHGYKRGVLTLNSTATRS